MMRGLNEVWDRIVKYTSSSHSGAMLPRCPDDDNSKSVECVTIGPEDVPQSVRDAVVTAGVHMEKLSQSLDIARHVHDSWGTDQLKEWKVSPDAVAQLAMQLAYFLTRRDDSSATIPAAPSTYESCSMLHFSSGRTETVRPASEESRAFVLAAARDKLPPLRLRPMLDAAAGRHRRHIRDVLEGKGFDRHLYALKCAYDEDASPLSQKPAIFDDPSWDSHFSNVLSTSTVSSVLVDNAIFGPTHELGFGVAYHLERGYLAFGVTAYAPNSAKAFARNLGQALRLIDVVLRAES